MNKIKVVRIITRLNIGGPAVHVVLLSEGVNKDRFETILVTGALGKGEEAYRKEGQVKADARFITSMKRVISPINDLRAFYNLFTLLKKEKPFIVHTHTAKAGFLGRLAATLAGVPVRVHSFHGHVFHSYFGRVQTKMFILIERFFATFTDKVVVVSDSIKEDICGRFKIADRTRTSVIRLGHDLDRFKGPAPFKGRLRKELGIADDTVLIGSVGRLTAVKNHKMLLDAARILGGNARFVMIGDGELRKELEDYAAKLGLKDSVYFAGWHKEMPDVYADMDIVALTSLNEGTPLALIEAMASGKAVVATSVGGVPDLIIDGKTGLLVRKGDAPAFAKALAGLIADTGFRARLGKEASEFAYSNFSKNRLISDIENLYEELISEKRGIKK